MGHHPERPYVSRRDFLRRSAVVGGAVAAGPWFWRRVATAAEVPVRQLHLTFGANAAREGVISFMTPSAVEAPFAEIAGSRLAARTMQYAGYPGYFHHVHLVGLDPATRYTYRVGHGNHLASPERAHTTAPDGRAPFTFTAFGDQGTDGPVAGVPPISQPPVQASANVTLANSFDPALHLIVGDLAYANGDQAIWDDWFDMIEPMADRVPWMPCLGNHEIETQLQQAAGEAADSWGKWGYDPYRTRFALPSNGTPRFQNCYYTFRYGSVQFVSLDNNDINDEVTPNIGYTGGAQKRWAEATFKAARSDPAVDFIVVLMHQCAFSSSTKHGSDPGVQRTWGPLFAKYHVDIVFQGHDHVYERTHGMKLQDVVVDKAPYATDVGTVFVTCGNGGAVQEPFLPTKPAWSAFRAPFKIGTVRIDVDPAKRTLTLGEYWAMDGSVIEEGIVLQAPVRRVVEALPVDDEVRVLGVREENKERSLGSPVTSTPVTGGPGTATVIGTAAAAAATAARLYVNRDDA